MTPFLAHISMSQDSEAEKEFLVAHPHTIIQRTHTHTQPATPSSTALTQSHSTNSLFLFPFLAEHDERLVVENCSYTCTHVNTWSPNMNMHRVDPSVTGTCPYLAPGSPSFPLLCTLGATCIQTSLAGTLSRLWPYQ